MFLAHLWATEYAAPLELRFTSQRGSTKMSPLRGWERSLWSFGARSSKFLLDELPLTPNHQDKPLARS